MVVSFKNEEAGHVEAAGSVVPSCVTINWCSNKRHLAAEAALIGFYITLRVPSSWYSVNSMWSNSACCYFTFTLISIICDDDAIS